MGFGFLLVLVLAVAIFVAAEFLMARSSKWDVLVQKCRTSGTPQSGWRGCRFLQLERQEGNTLKRTSYTWGAARYSTNIWVHLFPKAFVSASRNGLYFKRQPWNFLHTPILIPWNRVSSVRTATGPDHAAGLVGRQTGIPAPQFTKNMPGVVAGVMNALSGDVVEISLIDPTLRIYLPASSAGNLEQYIPAKAAAKPQPTPAPTPVGVG